MPEINLLDVSHGWDFSGNGACTSTYVVEWKLYLAPGAVVLGRLLGIPTTVIFGNDLLLSPCSI